jgi:hypothetical protein
MAATPIVVPFPPQHHAPVAVATMSPREGKNNSTTGNGSVAGKRSLRENKRKTPTTAPQLNKVPPSTLSYHLNDKEVRKWVLTRYISEPQSNEHKQYIKHECSDDKLMTIVDAHPKATHHWLILPCEIANDKRIDGVTGLVRHHITLLLMMRHRAIDVINRFGNHFATYQIGFHAIPSKKLLHLHVLSQGDITVQTMMTNIMSASASSMPVLCGSVAIDIVRRSHHSFTSPQFLDIDFVIHQITGNGRVHIDCHSYRTGKAGDLVGDDNQKMTPRIDVVLNSFNCLGVNGASNQQMEIRYCLIIICTNISTIFVIVINIAIIIAAATANSNSSITKTRVIKSDLTRISV